VPHEEKTWNPSARVRARGSREFSRVIGWLTFSAVKFRPCHANANCSRLGRGHECGCGPRQVGRFGIVMGMLDKNLSHLLSLPSGEETAI
jgi:hypothetical protein